MSRWLKIFSQTRLCIRKTLNFEQTEYDGENNSQNRKWLSCAQSLIILCKVAARETQARERRGSRAEEKKRPASSLVTQGQLYQTHTTIHEAFYMEALWLAARVFISSVEPALLCSDFVINKWLKTKTNSWRSRELFCPSAMMSVVSVNNDATTFRLRWIFLLKELSFPAYKKYWKGILFKYIELGTEKKVKLTGYLTCRPIILNINSSTDGWQSVSPAGRHNSSFYLEAIHCLKSYFKKPKSSPSMPWFAKNRSNKLFNGK